MHLQFFFKSYYKDILGKHSFEKIKKDLDLDSFLLENYFENTEYVRIIVEEPDEAPKIFKVNSVITSGLEHYTKNRKDEEFCKSEEFTEYLKLIEKETGYKYEKAFDISAERDSRYRMINFYYRYCSTPPTKMKTGDKYLAFYSVMSKRFTSQFMRQLLQDTETANNKEKLIKYRDLAILYSEQIKTEFIVPEFTQKLKFSDSKQSAHSAVELNSLAYSEIAWQIEDRFPLIFEDTSQIVSKKIMWQAEPELFFFLFSTLIDENFIQITEKERKMGVISSILSAIPNKTNFEIKKVVSKL
jgi:hypothetical protein